MDAPPDRAGHRSSLTGAGACRLGHQASYRGRVAHTGPRVRWLLAVMGLLLSACATAASDPQPDGTAPATTTTELPATTTAVPATTTIRPTTTRAPTTTLAKPPPTTATELGRSVTEQEWTPFATVGGIVLSHPSSRVERVGFHESNHEGAQPLVPVPTAVSPVTLEARDRGTASSTAADVVMDPDREVRAPVTGRVKRAGTYVLYCKHSDDYAVIAPDEQPTWEVKILHIDGVRVRAGQRVKAGTTVLAPRPTQLPFQSQVDELRTVDPPWPHVHIEVVDPAIKNRPSPNSGC